MDLIKEKAFSSGLSFEEEIYQGLRELPNLTVEWNKKVYSTQLDRDTQIDFIVCKGKKILILEAKNAIKSIIGDVNENNWVLVSRYSKKIFNPIVQNHMHIQSLKNFYIQEKKDIKDKIFLSIIVVPDTCKVQVAGETEVKILPLTKLYHYLLKV